MSNFNPQILRSEVAYRREVGTGRLSEWARAEGRCERLVRRARFGARRRVARDAR